MIPIIKQRSIWLILSSIMVIAAVLSLAVWQLRLGIDFTGGSLLEVSYAGERPNAAAITQRLKDAEIKDAEVKVSGEKEVIMRFSTVNEDTHQKILTQLKKDDSKLIEKSFESIGPVIGTELKQKSLLALVLAIVMILFYITFAFRKVSFPVASWKYGLSAILALFHDLVFVLGIFAVLGKFAGIELTSAFIPAFLTVLGFSVHDTIVVFDRIRENLIRYSGSFHEIVQKSLSETIVRSINTSVTVLLVLAALYMWGGETLRSFSLALFLGIAIGTYSSIFVASPMLVLWHDMTAKRRGEKA